MPEAVAAARRLTIGEALREAIAEEMRRDPDVFLLGEDIGVEGGFGGAFGVYLGLVEEFGHERIIDTPISEKVIAGAAVGAAVLGMRPVADVQYADFLFECMDELVNQAAKLRYMSGGKIRVPMVMRAPVGATTRGAQHGQCPESYFVHVPGLKVVAPSDAYHAKGILKSAIRDDNPVLVFEHKLLYGSKGREAAGGLDLTAEVPAEEYLVPIGKAVIKRPGAESRWSRPMCRCTVRWRRPTCWPETASNARSSIRSPCCRSTARRSSVGAQDRPPGRRA